MSRTELLVDLLALLPCVAALLVALRRRRARIRGIAPEILFCALACVSAAVLLLRPFAEVGERVVVILDDAAQAGSVPPAILRAGGMLHIVGCAAVALQGGVLEGHGVAATNPHPWRADCEQALRSYSLEGDPEQAVRAALELLRQRPWYQRATDALRQRASRVILLLTAPKAWRDSGWRLAVPELVARFARQGATFELVQSERSEGKPRTGTSVRIAPRVPFIPAAGETDSRFSFDLELAGFSGEPTNLTRTCLLGGDCFDDKDCSDGARCRQNLCRKTCEAGESCLAGNCTAGACIPDAESNGPGISQPFVLETGPLEVSAVRREYETSLVTAKPITLGEFTGPGNKTLPIGWVDLRCRINSDLVNAFSAGGSVVAEAELYLQSRRDEIVLVWGTAGRFQLGPGAVNGPSVEELRYAIERAEFIYKGPALYDTTPIGAPLVESDLVLSKEADCAAQAVKKDLRCIHPPPQVLVMHDVQAAAWKVYCPWIREQLETRGMTLVVSGMPGDFATYCPWSPVAVAPEGSAQQAVAYDRRPRLTFLTDASRLGRIRFKPGLTPVTAPSWESDEGLADGFSDVQVGLMKKVADEWKAAVVGANDKAQPAPEWVFDDKKGDFTSKATHAYTTLKSLQLNPTEQVNFNIIGTSADTMAQASALNARITSLGLLSPAKSILGDSTIRPHHVVVLFTYDLPQPKAAQGAVAQLLSDAAKVVVIPLRSPYGPAVDGTNAIPLRSYLERELTLSRAGPAAGQKALRQRLLVAGSDGTPKPLAGLPKGALPAIDLTGHPERTVVAQAAKGLAGWLTEEGRPDHNLMQVMGLDRFIDERVLEPGVVESPASPAVSKGGVPLRFQRVIARDGVATAIPLLRIGGKPKDSSALDPVLVGAGGLVGRGHALFLGYSVFEGGLGDFRYRVPWETNELERLWVPPTDSSLLAATGHSNRWGPQRILDVAGLTSGLEPLPTSEPRVRSVIRAAESGALRFEIQQRLDSRAAFEAPFLAPIDPASEEPCSTIGSAALRLFSLQPDRNTYVYELAPTQRAVLCRGDGCMVRLCRPSCAGQQGPCVGQDVMFLAADKKAGSPLQAFDDIEGIGQAKLLARYTGTLPGDEIQPVLLSLRIPASILIALALGAFWLLVGVRRLVRGRRITLLSNLEGDALLDDPPTGLVRQAGESLGVPSPTVPAGAFAGYRSFDPGDKLGNALRTDVVVMSGSVGFEITVVPRVIQRIEDRSRHVRFIVNVGKSMRLPGSSVPPKLLAACRLTEMLAEIAWSVRGEVVFEAVGVGNTPVPFGPHLGPPGSDGVLRFLLDPAFAKHATWNETPPLSEAQEGESLLYISDLLNEDLDHLEARLRAHESDGGSAAVVHVHSPAERQQTELCVHGATGLIVSRFGYDDDDMLVAQQRFVAIAEARFGDLRGGLLSISSAMRATQLLALVRDTQILGLLR